MRLACESPAAPRPRVPAPADAQRWHADIAAMAMTVVFGDSVAVLAALAMLVADSQTLANADARMAARLPLEACEAFRRSALARRGPSTRGRARIRRHRQAWEQQETRAIVAARRASSQEVGALSTRRCTDF